MPFQRGFIQTSFGFQFLEGSVSLIQNAKYLSPQRIIHGSQITLMKLSCLNLRVCSGSRLLFRQKTTYNLLHVMKDFSFLNIIRLIFQFLTCYEPQSLAFITISDSLYWASRLERLEERDLSEVLEQVLGYGKISREKFFKIIETRNKKKLSSREFLKLLEIIEKQRRSSH